MADRPESSSCAAIKSYLDLIETFLKSIHTQFTRYLCRSCKSLKCDRVFYGIFTIFVSKIYPTSREKRKHVLAYVLGFILGSFLYVFGSGMTYASNYKGTVIRNQGNSETYLPTNRKIFAEKFQSTSPSSFTIDKRNKAPLGTIPHIIHQSWETEDVPLQFFPWMASWHRNHPNWQHTFWTKAGADAMVQEQFQLIHSTVYNNYTTALHRYLVNRYLILYLHGGVYVDLDMESTKTLDSLLSTYSCVLTEQPLVHRAVLFNNSSPNYIVNSFIACEKGHPFLKFVLEMLDTYLRYDVDVEPWRERVEKSVGSLFLGDIVQMYRAAFNTTVDNRIHVLPSQLLMPNYNERHRNVIVHRCLYQKLDTLGERVCGKLKVTDFSNKLPRDAYNKCNWVDLHDPSVIEKLSFSETLDVTKLNASFYQAN